MVWCDSCSSYHDAASGPDDGTCPACGAVLTAVEHEEARTVGQSAPWHFWIVVVALAGYLLWRLVDGIIWLVS